MAEEIETPDVERLASLLGPLAEPVARPFLIVMSGLPGTGKSYFSRRLAERLPAVILESDSLGKALLAAPSYSAEESRRLFRASHILIERLLSQGRSVIFDATNLSERHREHLYQIAERLGARLILVRVEAPPALVHERLNWRRRFDPEASSDADWRVYQQMRPTVERIRRRHYTVNTARDISPVISQITREVHRRLH